MSRGGERSGMNTERERGERNRNERSGSVVGWRIAGMVQCEWRRRRMVKMGERKSNERPAFLICDR